MIPFWLAVSFSSLLVVVMLIGIRGRWWNLFGAVTLIAATILMVAVCLRHTVILDIFGGKIQGLDREKLYTAFTLSVFPFIFGGIGINLLSDHLKYSPNSVDRYEERP